MQGNLDKMSAFPIPSSNDLSAPGRKNESPPFANDNRDNGSSKSDQQTLGGHSHTDGQPPMTDDTIWSQRLESNTPLKNSMSSPNQTNDMNSTEKSMHHESQGPGS